MLRPTLFGTMLLAHCGNVAVPVAQNSIDEYVYDTPYVDPSIIQTGLISPPGVQSTQEGLLRMSSVMSSEGSKTREGKELLSQGEDGIDKICRTSKELSIVVDDAVARTLVLVRQLKEFKNAHLKRVVGDSNGPYTETLPAAYSMLNIPRSREPLKVDRQWLSKYFVEDGRNRYIFTRGRSPMPKASLFKETYNCLAVCCPGNTAVGDVELHLGKINNKEIPGILNYLTDVSSLVRIKKFITHVPKRDAGYDYPTSNDKVDQLLIFIWVVVGEFYMDIRKSSKDNFIIYVIANDKGICICSSRQRPLYPSGRVAITTKFPAISLFYDLCGFLLRHGI